MELSEIQVTNKCYPSKEKQSNQIGSRTYFWDMWRPFWKSIAVKVKMQTSNNFSLINSYQLQLQYVPLTENSFNQRWLFTSIFANNNKQITATNWRLSFCFFINAQNIWVWNWKNPHLKILTLAKNVGFNTYRILETKRLLLVNYLFTFVLA